MALADVARARNLPGLAGVDETWLGYLLDAASDFIESWCGRVFTSAEFTEVHDGNGLKRLHLRNMPITDVAQVDVLDSDGETESIDNSGDDQLTYDPNTGALVFLPTATSDHLIFTRGFQNITVTYTAGYASIPEELQEITCQLALLMSEDGALKGLKVKGVASETLDKYSYTLQRAADRALSRMSMDVLRRYRVPRGPR